MSQRRTHRNPNFGKEIANPTPTIAPGSTSMTPTSATPPRFLVPLGNPVAMPMTENFGRDKDSKTLLKGLQPKATT